MKARGGKPPLPKGNEERDKRTCYPHVEKSLELKKNLKLTQSGSFSEIDPGQLPFFEHFLIIGAQPMNTYMKGEHPPPQILFCYPSKPLLLPHNELKQIVDFCFPEGLHRHHTVYHRHSTLIHQTVFLNHFVFKLAGNQGLPIYGVCCHIALQKERLPFFSNEKSCKFSYCLCFLTMNTDFAFLFHLLFYFALIFDEYIDPFPRVFDQPNEVVSGYCNFDETFPYLNEKKGAAFWPGTEDLANKQFIKELLYFKTRNPSSKRKYSLIKSQDLLYKFSIIQPSVKEDYLKIANSCLDTLFSCLSVENLIILYSAILLEHHVIFCSHDIGKLTLSILALIPLVYPLQIGAQITPVVPCQENFINSLESPFPYIAGILSKRVLDNITKPEHLCFVDLEEGSVQDDSLAAAIPRSDELIIGLKGLIKSYQQIIIPEARIQKSLKSKDTIRNPKYAEFFDNIPMYMNPPILYKKSGLKYAFYEEDLINKILDKIQKHFLPELSTFAQACFVTDSSNPSNPITIFNKDLFTTITDAVDGMEFYRHFSETQIFSLFIDKRTDETDLKRQEMFNSENDA